MARNAQPESGLNTGSLIKYGLLAGGAYLLWSKYMNADGAGGISVDDLHQAVNNAAGGGSTPPPAGGSAPPAGTNPPPAANAAQTVAQKLVTDLKAAASTDAFFIQQGGKGTAHQWNYYRNNLRPPALTGEQFGAAFPDAGGDNPPKLTAEEFVTKLAGANVGLGAVLIPLPLMVNVNGKRTVIWASRATQGARA